MHHLDFLTWKEYFLKSIFYNESNKRFLKNKFLSFERWIFLYFFPFTKIVYWTFCVSANVWLQWFSWTIKLNTEKKKDYFLKFLKCQRFLLNMYIFHFYKLQFLFFMFLQVYAFTKRVHTILLNNTWWLIIFNELLNISMQIYIEKMFHNNCNFFVVVEVKIYFIIYFILCFLYFTFNILNC